MSDSTWDSERPTLVTCLACGGHSSVEHLENGKYRMVTCRWCLNGAMTVEQVNAWQDHRKETGG